MAVDFSVADSPFYQWRYFAYEVGFFADSGTSVSGACVLNSSRKLLSDRPLLSACICIGNEDQKRLVIYNTDLNISDARSFHIIIKLEVACDANATMGLATASNRATTMNGVIAT